MTRAAGLLILAPDNKALFLQRAQPGDYAGYWCVPGGKLEDGESPEQAAIREAREETGFEAEGTLTLLTRTIRSNEVAPAAPATASTTGAAVGGPPAGAAAPVTVDFTTYVTRVDAEFVPTLDGEHTAYAWTPVDKAPDPLHPGVAVTLRRLMANETEVAKMIMAGDLPSPQRYENMSLFDMRITGTGTAYRKRFDEFVYRRPENYLMPDFLERCNGLPVIMEHPDAAVLNSTEFADRIVGTIVLPYIKGDEVWGIAKIYDDAAIKMMTETQMSTSPSVVFREPSVNSRMELEDGSKLLIEGKPSLLDHLAICEQGVWDKGQKPSGVVSDTIQGDVTVPDDIKEVVEETKKADAAEGGDKLDKVLAHLDSLHKRMDAFEAEEKIADKAKRRHDDDDDDEENPENIEAKRVIADKAKRRHDDDDDDDDSKARKDAKRRHDDDDDDDEEKAKADAAKRYDDVARRIDQVEAMLPKQISDADYAAMADAQAKADKVFSAFGDSAPRPLNGETLLAYRRRLATGLKQHSATWKPVELSALADDAAFTIAETQIYADATAAAMNPAGLPEGSLREIVSTDLTGRRMISFVGEPRAWMSNFSNASNRRRLAGIRNNGNR
jgi:8-oxo-dGTP pyrophosphatase MutT (NUDIX family)